MTWVVVPAAGSGQRVGADCPKQYLPVLGKPLIAWTLDALLRHHAVSGVIVALAQDDQHFGALTLHSSKPIRCCVGGDDRATSVYRALVALADVVRADEMVWVHDAARPCISQAELDALHQSPAMAAMLAMPSHDTLKQVDRDGRVVGQLDRSAVWRAQTPQRAPYALLLNALAVARDAGQTVTDEASALSLAGITVQVVAGSERNLKVTTADDLRLAAQILAES